MNIIGVIPARFGSTRFPGKPLHYILGKPLLQWVIEGSKSSKMLSEIIVATDHEEIKKLAQNLGVKVVMTDSHLATGSDRIWAAIQNVDCDAIINIQGDEPLISGDVIDSLAKVFQQDKNIEMATLATSISHEELSNPNVVKVVTNKNDEAIYFSRFSIPYSREIASAQKNITSAFKHVGMYGYTKNFLKKYCSCAPVEIEKMEALEQLRALYLGARIKVVFTEHKSIGVDVPQDVEKVERMLK